MHAISREDAKKLIDNRHDLSVVEVLDEEQYRQFHLPGARNVPLDESFEENIEKVAPEKDAPVLVYCMDSECRASEKAAKRLAAMGYTQVYDYEAGKVDWKESGMPIEEPAGSSM